jgi:hypothetical protein
MMAEFDLLGLLWGIVERLLSVRTVTSQVARDDGL